MQVVRITGGEDDVRSLARASQAISSRMPELPPITMIVCPSRPRSRGTGEESIETAMIPPDVVAAHAGSSVPACSAAMHAAHQPGQSASRC